MHLHYSMFASSDRLVEICLVIVQSSSPQTFWYQDPVSWKTIFPWTGNGRTGLEIIQVHHIYCVLYFYYFQSHLRSLGIRYLRLGTPELEIRLLMRNEILLLLFSHCLTYWLHVTPWSVHNLPCPSLSQCLIKFMSIESVMLFNHLMLCHPFSFCLQFWVPSNLSATE